MSETLSWSAIGSARDARLDRARSDDAEVVDAVSGIIREVRERGDNALFAQTLRYDGVALKSIEVAGADMRAALDSLDPEVRAGLEQAAESINRFHRAQIPTPLEIETSRGVRVGRRAEPLRRVGVYVPGGRAAYASSVLMGVLPAKIAGVDEVVVCSPPGPDGAPPQAVLAASALAGADRVFSVGGAGAVAAMALGTATIDRVDRIVGPGNVYVTEAKRQLNGVVAIDCPAGPSEILVIADDSASPRLIAGELLAQAEHDPDAACVLLTTSQELIMATRAAADELVARLPDSRNIRQSLAARGAILRVESLEEAVDFAESYAPEHLLIATRDPRSWLARVRCAGTVFLGQTSSVVFGDYITGANHVLPTGGLSRAYSGLSTSDFLRWCTYQEVDGSAAARLSGATACLATAEGLPAHALAAELRGSAGGDAGTADSSPSRPFGRQAYCAIELYDPKRAPCETDLSDNTNLFGEDAVVRRAIADAPTERVARYPHVYAQSLKEAIAAYHGVAAENVVTGCGSDDVIDSVLRAFVEPGGVIAYPEPTFGMIPTFARMNALAPRAVPLGTDFELDVDALLAARASVTYVCNPNNPTGTEFRAEDIFRLAEEGQGILLLDEAYADFAGNDLTAWAAASENLIVLRTFSKALGLAGLRVGYAVGPAGLVREIEKSRGPYKVSGVAEAAAIAVLENGADTVRQRIVTTKNNRTRLTEALRERGFEIAPSAANFLLIAVHGAPASDWALALREQGIGVRAFMRVPGMGECIRVTIGPWTMLEHFLTGLDASAAKLEQVGRVA